MPSEFFDKLVRDRRDGVAPPQLAAEEQEAARPADVMVIFHPAPFDGLSVCGGPSGCHSLLVTEHAPAHAEWHRGLAAGPGTS